MNPEQHVMQLSKTLNHLTTPGLQHHWMLAAATLFLRNDMMVMTRVTSLVECNFPLIWKTCSASVEEQNEFSVVAMRLISLVLLHTTRNESSIAHTTLSTGKEGGAFLSLLFSLLRMHDPLFVPLVLISLQSLSHGPARMAFFQNFAAEGGNEGFVILTRMFQVASERTTATVILRGLLETKEGIRLCAAHANDMESMVSGTPLEKTWKTVRRL